ncbi:MAG TPA: DUF885 domain-containing protein, partial [Sphingomicrobium sp.]|nr:DUF885 domain-containing protein [Sphingomicrobium sp.]
MRKPAVAIGLALFSGTATAQATAPEARLAKLADAYVAARMERDPGMLYDYRLPAGGSAHERLADLTPAGQRKFDRAIDRLSVELGGIDRGRLTGTARIMHALLDEELAATRATRICRMELWDISHFEGAMPDVQALAAKHPVGTPALRRAAIARWSAMPRFVDQHISNLKKGMAAGFTVPRPVVERVIAQLDRTIALGVDKSPYYSPAVRDGDPRFAGQMRGIVGTAIIPSLKRYRTFLDGTYKPAARESLGLWALPEGAKCYRGLTRRYTTLDRTPEQLWAMGAARNAAGIAVATRIGRGRYGISDLSQILAKARAEPGEKYATPEAMLAEAQAIVARARTAFVPLFHSLPSQGVDVRADPPEMQGSGLPHRLQASSVPGGPATYWVPTHQFQQLPRSTNITASLHEAIPGHMMVAPRASDAHPLFRMSRAAVFNEGWAQYSETLGDEAGVRLSDTGRMILSPVDGRVVLMDIGIHHGGWTGEQAEAFYLGNGGHPRRFEDLLLRLAAFPAYSIAYDIGKAEILSLRAEAERALGDRFDIRDFHAAVLRDGPVPLWLLRENV